MFDLKSSTSVQNLGALVVLLILLNNFHSANAGFDLNEMPEDGDFDADLNNFAIAPPTTTTTTTTPSPSTSGGAQKVGPRVTPAQYAKVQALFKMLQICDIPNFNIKTVHVPESFAKETKAMMALKEVAKRNLIAKQDKARYERIMKNCAQLAKAVHTNTDQAMGPESQQSGGYDEDKEAQRLYEMRNSPLAKLENRFSEGERSEPERRPKLAAPATTTTTTTTTPSPEEIPKEVVQEGVTLFKFL